VRKIGRLPFLRVSDKLIGLTLFSAAFCSISLYSFIFQNTLTGRRLIAALVISALVTLIACFLANQFLLRPASRRLTPGQIAASLPVALLSGALLLTFSPVKIPGLPFFPNHLEIFTAGQVDLLGFNTDAGFISYHSLVTDDHWQRNDSVLSASAPLARLSWQGLPGNATLIFRTGPQAGQVQVAWDGLTTTYNLYAPEPGEFEVRDNLRAPPPGRLIAGSSALLTLAYAILLLEAGLLSVWNAWKTQTAPLLHLLTHKESILLAVFSLAGVALFYLLTSGFGLRLISDSSNYLSAARHLAAGDGYIALDTDVYTWWPPLYPAILAIFEWLPLPAFEFTRLFHAGLSGLTIFTSGLLFKSIRPQQTLPLGYFAALLTLVLVSRALNSNYILFLSEALFNWVILAGLLFLIRTLQYNRTGDLLLSVLFAALAPLTRYIGISLILCAGLALLFFRRGSWLRRLLQAAAFGIAAGLPTALWLWRNQVMTGSFTGIRTPAQVGLLENSQRTWQTFSGWFVPQGWELPFALLLILGIIYWLWKHRLRFSYPAAQSAGSVALFTAVYTGQLLITLSLVHNASIGDRLLSPIFVPVALLLTWLALDLFRLSSTRVFKNFARTGGALLMIMMLVAPARYLSGIARTGVETYNGDFSIHSLHQSDTIEYLVDHPLPGASTVYSNCPRCLYVFAGIQPAFEFHSGPRDYYLAGETMEYYLVWFDEVPPPGKPYGPIYELPDLAGVYGCPVQMTALARLEDGQIFHVVPPNPPCSPGS
jgi:hypothetical protein